MLERAKKIWQTIVTWWNKFSPKQKTAIISISAGVVLAVAILMTVLLQPNYELLGSYDTQQDAKAVMDLLDENEIVYQRSEDNLTIKVLKKDLTDANLILGTNGIAMTGYTIDDALAGSFTTTEADKSKKYIVYLESKFISALETYEFVDKAYVSLNIPEDDGTLISLHLESYASVNLKLNAPITQEVAAGMARYIATALGNDTTSNIVIQDTTGYTWFSGGNEDSLAANLSSQLDARAAAAVALEAQACNFARASGTGFTYAEASANAYMSYDSSETLSQEYTPADGQAQGVLDSETRYEESSTSGTSGVPGTDSNGETTYTYLENGNSESSVVEYEKDYLPNTTTTSLISPAVGVVPEKSSIAVTLTKLTYVYEETVKRQGLLAGVSWDEYKDTFVQNTPVEVSQDIIAGIANATGIPSDNITVIASERFEFIDSDALGMDIWDLLTIALIVIILGLLGFVVYTSFRNARSAEEEEELSVENLLQSAPPELENIELESKSETRRVIEKFVDDNPEAVSNLLRNWLNEDWG